ncbi:hypothetical protein GCM10027600_35110 [Nocardioides ginsengisegetis]
MTRLTCMRAALPAVVVTVATTFLLSACGQGTPVASDPGPSESPTPTASPTVGTYPAFAAADYAFTLKVSCFCADAGQPIRVTVAGGKVSGAVWARTGRGHVEGDPVEKYRWITINDVIDAANDTGAAQVDVTWPEGQDWPTSVYVDQSKNMADEEVGYTVSDVTVG